MATLRAVSFPSIHLPTISATPPFEKSMLFNPPDRQLTSLSLSSCRSKPKIKLLSAISSTVSTEPIDPPTPEAESSGEKEKFDWYSQWYPVAPVCDLDKRVPHAKRVMGLDVVVWWDRNEGKWQVFDDSCPHRLAPLSEGRIDQWGRLQCVYHGWCFDGAGNCKFIPQAPPDGAPVHSFKKACAAVYPSIEQNNIVWFWPSTEPRYKDIMMKQKPPYIPELDDPSYSRLMGNRDIPYGYEVLIENLMDPAHVPYAHYKIMRVPRPKSRVKADREGGRPMEINVQTLDINGFVAKQENGHSKFIPPCIFFASPDLIPDQGNGSASSGSVKKEQSQRRFLLIFICIPVSPGKSRLIWTFPRNFAVWIDRVVPRWMFHIGQNLILDSDLYLLHLEDQNSGKTIGTAREINGLYYFDETAIGNKKVHGLSSTSSISVCDQVILWHRRLGHPSFPYLKHLFPKLFKGIDWSKLHCEACHLAKDHRVLFPIKPYFASKPFYLLHSDVWGLSKVNTLSGKKWFVTFIDDHIRVCWVSLLEKKLEIEQRFKEFFLMVENQFQTKIGILRSDNGTEYFNKYLGAFLTEKGIIHQSTCRDTPQQNGIAERKNRHLLEVARAIMFSMNVPKYLWGNALLTACYLINRMPSRVLKYENPLQNLKICFPTS